MVEQSFASLRLRFVAFLLDYLVISAYLVLLMVVGLLIRSSPLGGAFGSLFANPVSAEMTAFLLLVLPVILYFALFELSAWQASPGKRRMGLQVTDEQRREVKLCAVACPLGPQVHPLGIDAPVPLEHSRLAPGGDHDSAPDRGGPGAGVGNRRRICAQPAAEQDAPDNLRPYCRGVRGET